MNKFLLMALLATTIIVSPIVSQPSENAAANNKRFHFWKNIGFRKKMEIKQRKLAVMAAVRLLAENTDDIILTEEDLRKCFYGFMDSMPAGTRTMIWDHQNNCLRDERYTELERCCYLINTHKYQYILFAGIAYKLGFMPFERLKKICYNACIFIEKK